ncbi:hypothetical protein TURU_163360 [Turdus rufiventris]|nr:hypothetical protein TURU_163360 [Turdus rufiventris]
MALKSDFKPKLQIVYSVSLSVSSLLQSQQASAPELASQHMGLKVSNPSSAQLSTGQVMTWIRDREFYKALVDPHEPRNHQSRGTMEFMDGLMLRDGTAIVGHVGRWNQGSRLLQGSSVWVIPLLFLTQAPQTELGHGAAEDTPCVVCEIGLDNFLSCSSEE